LALSDLVLSLHLIPELGSSEHDVLGKDSDSVACWLWGSFTWKFSSDNPKLLDLYAKTHIKITIQTGIALGRSHKSRHLLFSAWRQLRHL
jgi:hypothetical protein